MDPEPLSGSDIVSVESSVAGHVEAIVLVNPDIETGCHLSIEPGLARDRLAILTHESDGSSATATGTASWREEEQVVSVPLGGHVVQTTLIKTQTLELLAGRRIDARDGVDHQQDQLVLPVEVDQNR